MINSMEKQEKPMKAKTSDLLVELLEAGGAEKIYSALASGKEQVVEIEGKRYRVSGLHQNQRSITQSQDSDLR